MTPNRLEHQLPVDAVEEALDVEVENPVIAPAALAGLGHGIDCRLAGTVAVGVGMKDRLQDRLQITTDDLLSDAIGDGRHGCFELHIGPVSLWDRSRSLTPFIPSEVISLLC
jgi:hypothetical protein